MSWTDERRKQAFAMWENGHSAARIAVALGGDATRNSVLGIIHRAGKAHRPGAAAPASLPRAAPPRLAQMTPPTPAKAIVPRLAGNGTVFHEPEARPPREVVAVDAEAPGLATVLSLGAYQCKWPIGDPQLPAFTHCGRSAPDGPYCADHAAIAYQKRDRKRPTTANELARSLRRYL